ncbi:MAG: hypothetical protein NVSMB17_00840 [Candidatus Dormibacteria bacterium]
MPLPGAVMVAKDFPALYDCEWGFQLGGWGGIARGGPRKHTPVIFVHGNQVDAENWFAVADQFRQLAGYTNQEMYALSYNGLECASCGAPTRSAPSPASLAYWQANPGSLSSSGHGTADDVNVPDLYAFILTVLAYTGAPQVNLVGHSLGVTLIRKTLFVHPELYPKVRAAVVIAGANHGTSTCRGSEQTLFLCDEVAPGSAWLQELNSKGESPGPTRWMSVYNGADSADPFFVYAPGVFDDRQSPHLKGATNVQFPAYYHNDLRVDPPVVATYLKFLLDNEPVRADGPGGHVPPQQPTGVSALPNTSR